MHSSSYPLKKESRQECKLPVKSIADEAEARIRHDFGIGDKSLTLHKLNGHLATKMLKKTLKSPENTPDDMRKFFKSD